MTDMNRLDCDVCDLNTASSVGRQRALVAESEVMEIFPPRADGLRFFVLLTYGVSRRGFARFCSKLAA